MNDASHILRALVNSDSRQIAHLYEVNFYQVEKFILQNKGQKQDAKDIFQKALLQITARYIKEPFEITASFDAYLFVVCKNLWRRELNKSKRWVTEQEGYEHADENQDIALSILEQKRWELFHEYLEKLSENCKEILKLFFNKVSYKRIIVLMNYNSESVARQRIFKCKGKLIDMVQKDNRYHQLKNL